MDEDSGLVSEGTMVDDYVPETPPEMEVPSLDSLTAYVQPSQCIDNGLHFTSPVKTLETVETIVSTNKVSVYCTVEAPRVGMVFKRWQDVESYYKEYAEQHGFGVTRQSGAFTKEKERRAIYWRCECWGPPDMRARREARKREKAMEVCGTGGVVNGEIAENELVRGKRTSKKCECEARIYASLNPVGDWVLRTVVLEHAHPLDPNGAKLVKEYRMKNYTSSVKKKLMDYYEEGVTVKQIHGCMATELGGEENLPTVKDLQHEVQKERRLKMEGGDAAAMMAYFDRMQADNQNFYHAHRLDQEGRLKDVLWVDARSRVAYEEFGDVVCFDATYLTNEYELPFANFVGVNHHGQSLLLGCALVSHENCDTFLWVFEQWLACMGNKPPGAILTDQAAAMRRPLAAVMPSTRHRWCIWHILRKLPEKLGKCENYEDFKSPLKTLIYESFTVEEFESRWYAFMSKWELEDNEIPVIKELCLLQKGEHTMELQSYRNDFKLFNVAAPLEVTRLVLSTATNTAHNLDGRVATLHVHVTNRDNQGMEMGMRTHTRFMLWNCRDMSREGFLHSLKEEVELHMPDVIVLTETRVSVNMARLILHSLFPYRVSGVSKANKEGGYVIITFKKQPTYMLCCSKSHCYTWAVVS